MIQFSVGLVNSKVSNESHFKMYLIDFLICLIIHPQSTDKYSKNKKNYVSSPCFDVPKMENFASSGVQTTKPKTGNLEWSWRHFRAFSCAKNRVLSHFLIFLWTTHFSTISRCNFEVHNNKMAEKCFLWKYVSWNDITIIPSLLLSVLQYPTRSEISRFW